MAVPQGGMQLAERSSLAVSSYPSQDSLAVPHWWWIEMGWAFADADCHRVSADREGLDVLCPPTPTLEAGRSGGSAMWRGSIGTMLEASRTTRYPSPTRMTDR
jgi:hypothetical protein